MKLLLVVDMQKDFIIESGSLTIKGALSLIPKINDRMNYYHNTKNKIVATKD
jgi:nicotinamidase-related amidase